LHRDVHRTCPSPRAYGQHWLDVTQVPTQPSACSNIPEGARPGSPMQMGAMDWRGRRWAGSATVADDGSSAVSGIDLHQTGQAVPARARSRRGERSRGPSIRTPQRPYERCRCAGNSDRHGECYGRVRGHGGERLRLRPPRTGGVSATPVRVSGTGDQGSPANSRRIHQVSAEQLTRARRRARRQPSPRPDQVGVIPPGWIAL
jgi:hypothetical protein